MGVRGELLEHPNISFKKRERYWRTAGEYLFPILMFYWKKRDYWICSKANYTI